AVALDQVRPVLRIGMRDEEALGSCFVACGDIGRTCKGKLDEVASPGSSADCREGVCDSERAVRDVMGTRRAGTDCPVDPTRRRVGGVEVRLRREDGQLKVADMQGS